MKNILFAIIVIFFVCSCNNSSNDDETKSAVPRDGLMVEYLFSGNLTNSVIPNPGQTIYGTPQYGIDRFGNPQMCGSFDGTTYISCNQVQLGQTSFSCSFWVKFNPQSTGALVTSGGTSDGIYQKTWEFFMWTSDTVRCLICAQESPFSTRYNQYYDYKIDDYSKWYHFFLSYDSNSNMTLYINDEAKASSIVTAKIQSPLFYGDIGAYFDQVVGTSYFYGLLDDIRVYDHVLEKEEIDALYHENSWK